MGDAERADDPPNAVAQLAVSGQQGSTSLPQVPTMRELGFSDPIFDTNVWIGLLVPARTPDANLVRMGKLSHQMVMT
jgi:tripartite-type tricarboxylate transporter receptor subunit TctC